MYYNVAQLLKEPVGSTRQYRLDQTLHPADRDSYISAQGQLSLMRTDRGIWLNAQLDAMVWSACSRCLSRYPCPVGIVMAEEFFPTVDVGTGQSLQVPEWNEGSFTIDRQHVLDLTEAVRQHIITNQPMKPLCLPDCLGLCSTCGANRNQHPCSCEGESTDPRWAPLNQLLRSSGR